MYAARSRFVAATSRKSTFISSFPPTRCMLRDSSARSSFTCVGRSISVISSRKSVPPSAASNLPIFIFSAPVNEPFSWPNSSDSISVGESAAHSTATNGPDERGERSWRAFATSSLPVPDGPSTSTFAFDLAAWRMSL